MGMYGVFAHVSDEELRAVLANPDGIERMLDSFEDDESMTRELNVEKSWHALHWLLTGSEWEGAPPLNFIVAGGTEVGDSDVSARVFTSDDVRAMHAALSPITSTELISRYDGHAMQLLYPEIWNWPDEQESNRRDLAYQFEALKGFVSHGAELGHGMLVYIG